MDEPIHAAEAAPEPEAELAEATERLGVGIVRLFEGRDERVSLDPELLNAVFREAHSIKGLAGLFGHRGLGELAHAAEDVLDGLRMGQLTASEEIEALLLALPAALTGELPDGLGGEIGGRLGGRPADVALDSRHDLRQRLRAVFEERAQAGLPPAFSMPPELRAQLTSYEEHRIAENLALGKGLYALRTSFPLIRFDSALRELRPRVQAIGELLATLPVPEEMTADSLACDLLVACGLPLAEVVAAAGAGFQVRELRPPLLARAGPAAERPAQTVRIDIRDLDRMMQVLTDLELVRINLARTAARLTLARAPALLVAEIHHEARSLDRLIERLQKANLRSRMVPLTSLFARTRRMVERVARELGKEIQVVLEGDSVEIDKLLAEALAEPLVHLTRNAVDHGIELPEVRVARGKPRQGRLWLRASQRGGQVTVEVSDDGTGIDPAEVRRVALERGLLAPADTDRLSHRNLVRLLLTPGFSTAPDVSALSGRGVGLDAVRAKVVSLAGFLEVDSKLGEGSTFRVSLPATLALVRALLVRVRGETYALPASTVLEVVALEALGQTSRALSGAPVPLVELAQLFGLAGVPAAEGTHPLVVLVGPSEQRVGLVVDGLGGQRDLVTKPLGPALGHIAGISGLAPLGPEQSVLVLDVATLVDDALGRPALRGGA